MQEFIVTIHTFSYLVTFKEVTFLIPFFNERWKEKQKEKEEGRRRTEVKVRGYLNVTV